MAVLKTDYLDDVLNTSVNTQRKYIQTNNADGTISLTDATSYTQEGSTFGAADINATNQEVNTLNENLTAEDNLQFKFGKDGDGNYGYYGADGSLIPFKSGFDYSEFEEELYFYSNTVGDAIYQSHVGYGRYSKRTSSVPALLVGVRISKDFPCQVGIITTSNEGLSCTGGEYGLFTEITGTSTTRKGHTVYWGYGSGAVSANQVVVSEADGTTHTLSLSAGLLDGGVTEFGLYLADKLLFNE